MASKTGKPSTKCKQAVFIDWRSVSNGTVCQTTVYIYNITRADLFIVLTSFFVIDATKLIIAQINIINNIMQCLTSLDHKFQICAI